MLHRITKDHLRRAKWIIAFLAIFCILYFMPYEVNNEYFFSFPLVGSLFFFVALYQIYGNYQGFIEFLDSLLEFDSNPVSTWLILLNFIIPIVLFFTIIIHYSHEHTRELREHGATIKAKVVEITEDRRSGRNRSLISFGERQRFYSVNYEYHINDKKYWNVYPTTSDMYRNYYQHSKPDSIEIVYSTKHNDLSATKAALEKMY